jgi:hypothetical protein
VEAPPCRTGASTLLNSLGMVAGSIADVALWLAIGILRHQNGRWPEWTHSIRRRQVRPLALTAVLSYSNRQPAAGESADGREWGTLFQCFGAPLALATLIAIDAKHK